MNWDFSLDSMTFGFPNSFESDGGGSAEWVNPMAHGPLRNQLVPQFPRGKQAIGHNCCQT